MIRVVVAEDHHLVRQGIVKLLEGAGDISVVGEADNGAQAIELVEVLQPDVMVLDLTMPHVDGLEALRQIALKRPRPQIVILSMHADPNIVRQTLRAGAVGYVVKQSVAECTTRTSSSWMSRRPASIRRAGWRCGPSSARSRAAKPSS